MTCQIFKKNFFRIKNPIKSVISTYSEMFVLPIPKRPRQMHVSIEALHELLESRPGTFQELLKFLLAVSMVFSCVSLLPNWSCGFHSHERLEQASGSG